MSDFEKSINASDLIDWIMCAFPDWCEGTVRAIVDHINEMAPAQPESCDGCKGCKMEHLMFRLAHCNHCRRNFDDMYEVDDDK